MAIAAKALTLEAFLSEQGMELGWLVDPDEETVLIVLPEQRVRLLKGLS
jgi:Uma2 family endonuclease